VVTPLLNHYSSQLSLSTVSYLLSQIKLNVPVPESPVAQHPVVPELPAEADAAVLQRQRGRGADEHVGERARPGQGGGPRRLLDQSDQRGDAEDAESSVRVPAAYTMALIHRAMYNVDIMCNTISQYYLAILPFIIMCNIPHIMCNTTSHYYFSIPLATSFIY